MAPVNVLVLVANGSEEMETIITVDVLRRAGIHVTLASVENSKEVTCSRAVKIVADTLLSDIEQKDSFNGIVIPGGLKGAETMAGSKEVQGLLQQYEKEEKLLALICAGPISLISSHVKKGKKMTSHPSVKEKFDGAYDNQGKRVVVDGNLITSQGPGTTFEFALSIVKYLLGKEKVEEISKPMILSDGLTASL